MTDSLFDHYSGLAENFVTYWSFENGYMKDLVERINFALDLNSGNTLVDLGGGTGSIGQLVAESANLTKWYCVDSSEDMLREAQQRSCATWKGDCLSFAQQFPFDYDRVLIKATIHHVPDRPSFFRELQHRRADSPSTTKVLIVTRPKQTQWPLFERARAVWARDQPSVEELFQECHTGVPWRKLEAYTVPFPVAIPRDQWYCMLRGRFTSELRGFTDAEIKEGIKELEEKRQKDEDPHDDIFHFTDSFVFIELHC